MVKRLLLVAIVVAAILVVAAPAMAFNGYRADYTTSDFCSICHSTTSPGSAPRVYERWAETAHANAGWEGQAVRLSYGSSCAGCHTSNYAPAKVIPTPTATTWLPASSSATPSPVPTGATVAWAAANGEATTTQMDGTAASSESFVGCSSCHYGAATADVPQYGNDSNDTAHRAPNANLANAEICGQCHSRYSYAANTTTVAAVPYVKLNASGSPIPNPSPTTLLQPQYAIGYKMLGVPTAWTPDPLSSVLIVQRPGVTPSPNPSATTAAGLQVYWQVNGQDSVWQVKGHDGGADQYPDWAVEGHSQALNTLKPMASFMDITPCLECHSTDYRIAPDGHKPTAATAQYGITCVGCHTPHDKGTAVGVWDDALSPQLRTDSAKTLCVTCHNGDTPVDTSASPGAEIHHPMKEMLDGYGAIDVASFPSVHKDKCVQCHMPPTTNSPLAANHTFKIIMPEVAAEATTSVAASGSFTGKMPYSACSGGRASCHATPADPYATWLQDTIDQRQAWTTAKIASLHTALAAGAVRLGYADEAAAHTALVAIPAADRTASQTNFLKAFTNTMFVENEGSLGLHNWDYSRAIVNTALVQANSVEATPVPTPWVVSIRTSKTSVTRNTRITLSGTVSPAASLAWGNARANIQRRVGNGSWSNWRNVTCDGSGAYTTSVNMGTKGTFRYRTRMAANSRQLVGTSASVQVRVR